MASSSKRRDGQYPLWHDTRSPIEAELEKLERRERKLMASPLPGGALKQKLFDQVPEKLRDTLISAFAAAFRMVFINGTGVIEKTFRGEDISLGFDAGDYVVELRGSKRAIQRMDGVSKRANLINAAFAGAEGVGLGLLGMGLPDIPVLVGTLLRGIYQTALSYGFDYDSVGERVFILRLIRTALCPPESSAECMRRLNGGVLDASPEREIELAAVTLADALLVEKFIQGIPIVGAVGGFVNTAVYSRVANLAGIKYKQRYLIGKLTPKLGE